MPAVARGPGAAVSHADARRAGNDNDLRVSGVKDDLFGQGVHGTALSDAAGHRQPVAGRAN